MEDILDPNNPNKLRDDPQLRSKIFFGDNDESLNATIKEIKETSPEGSFGAFSAKWIGGSGHSMLYQVRNGEVEIIDSQTSEKYKLSELEGATWACGYCRLDDANMDAKLAKAKGYIM